MLNLTRRQIRYRVSWNPVHGERLEEAFVVLDCGEGRWIQADTGEINPGTKKTLLSWVDRHLVRQVQVPLFTGLAWEDILVWEDVHR